MKSKLTKETRLIHDRGTTCFAEGTIPPISYSTAFPTHKAADLEAIICRERDGYSYSRFRNPTIRAYENRLTDLCDVKDTIVASSGMAAISLTLLSLLRSGDHILVSRDLFSCTYILVKEILGNLGVTADYFSTNDTAELAQLLKPNTKAVFVEAISNPCLVIPPFDEYHELLKARRIPLIVDATFLSPYLFDRHKIPADIAIFSSSKFIAGPASIIGGIIMDCQHYDWRNGLFPDIAEMDEAEHGTGFIVKTGRRLMGNMGMTPSPMDCFLQMLGLESLGVRMTHMSNSALVLAKLLEQHPRVQGVSYPNLKSSPYYQRLHQYVGELGSSIISFCLKDKAEAFAFIDGLKLLTGALNIGDSRSLACHIASTAYVVLPPEERSFLGVSDGLIRLSVGLENVDDLAEDIAQSLDKL